MRIKSQSITHLPQSYPHWQDGEDQCHHIEFQNHPTGDVTWACQSLHAIRSSRSVHVYERRRYETKPDILFGIFLTLICTFKQYVLNFNFSSGRDLRML